MHHSIQTNFNSAALFSKMVLKGLDAELWERVVPEMGSSLNWLVGHILLSKIIFGLELVSGYWPSGIDKNLLVTCYNRGTSAVTLPDLHPSKAELLVFMQQVDTEIELALPKILPSQWDDKIASPIPLVSTRLESALFAGSHQMYHNGQIAWLKKLL